MRIIIRALSSLGSFFLSIMKSPYIYIVIVYLRVSYLRVCKMQQYIMILLYTVAEFFSSKYADFFAQKQTQTESLSELFFRILFLHLLIGVCLIIKYSIVRLLYCFCWLLHIVYDVWTGTPYQCRCAGCSRLFAGITTPVLIKIHCTMSQMFISVRMMES